MTGHEKMPRAPAYHDPAVTQLARAASAEAAVQMEQVSTLRREEVRTQRFKAFLPALGGQSQSV